MISTFYIYADGYDLDDVAPQLLARIEEFVAPYGGRVRVVDQREKKEVSSEDLPAWDLGVNFEATSLTDAERRDLVFFFQSLSGELGREFVLGGVSPQRQAEDLVTISAVEPIERAVDLLTANEKKG